MKRILVSCVVVVLTGVVGLALTAQQSGRSQPSLKGVWRAMEITYTGPNARTVKSPQPWIVIFTEKHVASVGVTSDVPRPEWPPDQQTDKQVADAARSFNAFIDNYEVTGLGEFARNPVIVNLSPNNMRPGISVNGIRFRFDGNDTFYWTQPRTVANPSTWKFVRVE